MLFIDRAVDKVVALRFQVRNANGFYFKVLDTASVSLNPDKGECLTKVRESVYSVMVSTLDKAGTRTLPENIQKGTDRIPIFSDHMI